MNDTFTTEQVLEAYNNAPSLVKRVFNAEKTTNFLISLQSRFQLRVDNIGVLGREVGYLLLGLTNLGEFAERLRRNNLPDQTVVGLIEEINQKIFIPLREEMEHGGGGAGVPAPAGGAQPQPPQPQPERLVVPEAMVGMRPVVTGPIPPPPPKFTPASLDEPHAMPSLRQNYIPEYPRGVYAPPPQSPSYPNQGYMKVTSTPRVAPTQPQATVNKIQTPVHTQIHKPAQTPQTPPPVIKPIDPARTLEDHEEPSPALRASVPTTPSVPPILPGSMPPTPIAPMPAQMKPPLPSYPPSAPVAQTRPYSVDPYREPVDEKK